MKYYAFLLSMVVGASCFAQDESPYNCYNKTKLITVGYNEFNERKIIPKYQTFNLNKKEKKTIFFNKQIEDKLNELEVTLQDANKNYFVINVKEKIKDLDGNRLLINENHYLILSQLNELFNIELNNQLISVEINDCTSSGSFVKLSSN